MSPPSARQYLHAATLVVHERLHRHPLLLPLSGHGLTRARYRTALMALFGFQAAAAHALTQATEQPTLRLVRHGDDDADGATIAQRLTLLQRDLGALGLPETTQARLPRAWLPVPGTIPAYWGIRYVVDGSALGGRVIARTVAARIGLDADSGLAYFEGVGAEAGAAWRRMCARMELDLGRANALTDAAETAMRTFQRLEAWLDCMLAGMEPAAA